MYTSYVKTTKGKNMTHINRDKIVYRNCQRKVIKQDNNIYTIRYKYELLIVKIDAFNGFVTRV